jgi:hypothetical protein
MSSEEIGVKTRAQNAPLHPGLSNSLTKVTESEGKEKGTSTEPNSQPEDEETQVTVRHGSSAHGLGQETDRLEDEHVEKEESGDATPEANPTEPNDMDIVQEQEQERRQGRRKPRRKSTGNKTYDNYVVTYDHVRSTTRQFD